MENNLSEAAVKMETTQISPETELKRKAEEDEIKKDTSPDGISGPVEKCTKHEDIKNDMDSIVDEKNVDDAPRSDSVVANSDRDGESKPDASVDPLGYTKAQEFTSEIFKIQIHNLPKFGYTDLKKRLISLKLKPHKIKCPGRSVTYVCFRDEEERQEALKKINGHVWRGRKLEAREAAPSADPFLEKKRQQGNQNSDVSAVQEPLTFEEAQKKLKDNVAPLWEMDYSKQLETKTENIKSVLKKLTHQQLVREQFRRMDSWKQDGMPCPLLPIVSSPVTSEYRNKNEFTIGFSQDGETVKVGFRYGLYKNGTTTVGDATNIGVVKPAAVPVIESFEKFVCNSRWRPFLQQTGTGHWHTLTVRSFDSGDVMAMVDFHPRSLNKSEIDEAKESIKDFYNSEDGKDINIKSFYFRLYAKGPQDVPKLQKVFGDSHVYESLLGLKFRISPEAFFQVNTKATEKLYSLIGEWCEASESSTVLDICCGTGTIGLSMAKKVKQVIGVEMCESAVEDAKENAKLNDIANVTYFCSKVEDVIGQVLTSAFQSSTSSSEGASAAAASSSSPQPPASSSSPCPAPSSQSEKSSASAPATTTTGEENGVTAALKSNDETTTSAEGDDVTTSSSTSRPEESDIIAVVDPPRAGLHKSVIKMLRKTEEIQRLVYVSCNPENAKDNFVDLIRPSSSKLRGRPFNLVKAVPVDLFPGTKHCELVLLLTR